MYLTQMDMYRPVFRLHMHLNDAIQKIDNTVTTHLDVLWSSGSLQIGITGSNPAWDTNV